MAAVERGAPRLRIKCRLHPCPAYRILDLPAAADDPPSSAPTLDDVQQRAAAAWHLPSSAGLLLAALDAEGDEIALLEQREWEAFLRSLSPHAALVRLCLARDPRSGFAQQQPSSSTSAARDQASEEAQQKERQRQRKSAMDERNDALASAFSSMLANARSTETVASRSRDYANRFYSFTRAQFPQDSAGAGGAASGSGSTSGATAAGAQASSVAEERAPEAEMDELERKRQGWKARGDQLYGNLVAPPARHGALAAPEQGEGRETSEEAAAQAEAEQVAPPPPPNESTERQQGEGRDEQAQGSSVEGSSDPAPAPAPTPAPRPARPKRPVEEVNQELNSAWDSMLARMRGG
ncbi:hypothetical protein OC834_000252 [Tilletia horrida]|nr:hypothetical protein OC834_000252 [Tilletia horrida]